MVPGQRTPAARLEDIPGELPKTTIPANVDLKDVAAAALLKLNDWKLANLAEIAIWKDFLALTGTFRTFYSADTVFQTWRKLGQASKISAVRLKEIEPRISTSLADCSWVDVDVWFTTQENQLLGLCHGVVSLCFGEDGAWKIWMIRTWLEAFDGYGYADRLDESHLKPDDDRVEVYDAIVVGGGQCGLAAAGRLKALGLKYLLLESNPNIGDVWKNRYDSLRWHTSNEYGQLLFDRTYSQELYMVPTKRIAAGQKAWAEKHAINVRTNSTVISTTWNGDTRVWTVISSDGESQATSKATNLILSIGIGNHLPISPSWAQPDKIKASNFNGTILHAKNYHSCSPWVGKRGIVVGTANTGHDVAEDFANAGMETTMIQRSPTFVFPVEGLHAAQDVYYNPTVQTEVADRLDFSYPVKVMRERLNRGIWAGLQAHPERLDSLEKAGFKLNRHGDLMQHIFERLGGHYIDTGASARIARGEIKMKTEAVKELTENGVRFEDGSEVQADLIVLCTGYDSDFRKQAAAIVGRDTAEAMDDYWGLDGEGEIRGHARPAGHPHLYYFGGDVRMARWYSRFIALQIQAEVLGRPLRPFLER